MTFMTDPFILDSRRGKAKRLISKTRIWSLAFPLGAVELNVIHTRIKHIEYYVTM
jgi:hypothetical protein